MDKGICEKCGREVNESEEDCARRLNREKCYRWRRKNAWSYAKYQCEYGKRKREERRYRDMEEAAKNIII